MKKDVLFIILDSVCQKNIGVGYSGVTTTPFLDSLKDKCLVCEKAYSQGPYTEAGTKALLCGEDTLSSGGYLLRYANARSFITDEFYNNGYETYCYMYPSALLSLETMKKTDHMIYTSGFEFKAVWKQKLAFYLQRFKQGVLDESDMNKCIQVMELVFFAWNAFFNPKDKEEAYRLIIDCLEGYDLKKNRDLLEKEHVKFCKDKVRYITELFKEEGKHSLFLIEDVDMRKMIHNDIIKEAVGAVKGLERTYKRIQKQCNRKNNGYTLINQCKDILKFIKSKRKYDVGKIYNYYKLLEEANAIKKCKNENDYKVVRSTRTIFEDVAKVMSWKTDRPKFVFIHTEDTHYFSTFFSYDSIDKECIVSEFFDANDYMSLVKESYRGNLMYDLSIRYVDKQLSRLFNRIQNEKSEDNLVMCVTADHGYSYNRYPLRERLVNNFYEENYQIPFYLYAGKEVCGEYPYFMLSKDILATLYECCAMKVSESVTGYSVLSGEKNRDYILTEYMGPGCPDLRHREVWISARNELRMVAVQVKLSESQLTYANIVEAYNLVEDPLEQSKLKEYDEECKELFYKIEHRWRELKEENI